MNKNNFKSGFVSIIGRPNVGKSTFINYILGQKVVIVTPKAQTTRNTIQAIYTTDKEQIIFVDTPGVHRARHELGKVMNDIALSSTDGIDVILFLIDATKPLDDDDMVIVNALKKVKCPVILVVNKIDLVKNEEQLIKNIESYKKELSFSGGITICAQNGQGVTDLIAMLNERLSIGPMYYPEDQILDQPERFVVAEIIREKILLLTEEEVPHSVAVSVESFKPHPQQPDMVEILATIIVERPSQKKIIIGAGGKKIKEVGTAARKDIVKFLGQKVYLELFVKIEPDWRNNKGRLREYGYQKSR